METLTFKIFFVFFKFSLISFGGVFGVFPHLEHELVTQNHWFTHDQVIEAFTLSQFVPGPNMVMCPMLGYQLNGYPGLIAAFLGIYLTPALLMWFAFSIYHRYRNISTVSRIEVALRPMVLGLISASTIKLWYDQSTHLLPMLPVSLLLSAGLTLGGIYFTQKKKVSAIMLLLVSGIVTITAYSLGHKI